MPIDDRYYCQELAKAQRWIKRDITIERKITKHRVVSSRNARPRVRQPRFFVKHSTIFYQEGSNSLDDNFQ